MSKLTCQYAPADAPHLHGEAARYSLFGDPMVLCEYCAEQITHSTPEERAAYYLDSKVGQVEGKGKLRPRHASAKALHAYDKLKPPEATLPKQ